MTSNTRKGEHSARLSWKAYDALPAAVRAALADAHQHWACQPVLKYYRLLLANKRTPQEAEQRCIAMIRRWDEHEIGSTHLYTPRRRPGVKAPPSPHQLAQATMLRSLTKFYAPGARRRLYF